MTTDEPRLAKKLTSNKTKATVTQQNKCDIHCCNYMFLKGQRGLWGNKTEPMNS